MLPPELNRDPALLLRFEREAKVAAALSHPNIITIFSVEEAENGLRFFTMELVEGKRLQDLIPYNLALTILEQEVEHEEDLQSLKEDLDLMVARGSR